MHHYTLQVEAVVVGVFLLNLRPETPVTMVNVALAEARLTKRHWRPPSDAILGHGSEGSKSGRVCAFNLPNKAPNGVRFCASFLFATPGARPGRVGSSVGAANGKDSNGAQHVHRLSRFTDFEAK